MAFSRKHVSTVSRNDPDPKPGQQLMSSDEVLDILSDSTPEKKQSEPRHAKPKK